MSRKLNRAIVAERLRNYQRDSYLNIGSVMMGVTLAGGTLVFMDIADDWVRLSFWGVSLLSVLVSYVTWGRGTLLTNSRGNIWDSILPLFLGITEFLLFQVLDPKNKFSSPNLWFYILATLLSIASFITLNRIKEAKIFDDFSPELRGLGREMLGWIKADRTGTRVGAILAFGCFFGLFFPSDFKWYHSIMTLPFSIIFITVLLKAENQRNIIEKTIFGQ